VRNSAPAVGVNLHNGVVAERCDVKRVLVPQWVTISMLLRSDTVSYHMHIVYTSTAYCCVEAVCVKQALDQHRSVLGDISLPWQATRWGQGWWGREGY